MLDAGLPLVAFLQLVRVYGQALAQIADAEVKLFHLYVHEPMIRDGAPVLDIAEELSDLASELLPLAGPIMDSVHQRLLQHFLEQDVVGHLELVADDAALGRVRVAIAFADLAGYTRLTEEVGEEEALEVVERFVELVGETLPDDARVIKTIGDEVMVVGTDASALADWAVGFVDAVDRAPAAADRHARRQRALPRRRLLRARGQPRGAGRRAGDRRRGAGHARGHARPPGATCASSRSARSSSRASTRRPSCSWPAACAMISGPVVVLFSGGRDSMCLLDLAVRDGRAGAARCTSTTGCAAPSPTPTRRTAARCASGSACS